ncbi:hypothetical protein DFP72DRAFT_1075803 [Ephemerocybe angulata]|uniref:F-box domain-containing protein n=1 Tax=Ephemerocybe angulata TaxID=980116 RepID=A0A8H6HIF7_9AGAR|nr:hypothetical protein DFP72DRAFT_1075803 [Tulosesus angulatus]
MGKRKLDTTDAPAKGKRAKLRREPAPELLEAVQNKDEAAPKIVGTTLPGGTSLRARVARAQVQPVSTRKRTQKAKQAHLKEGENNHAENSTSEKRASSKLDWGADSDDSDEGAVKAFGSYTKRHEKLSAPPTKEKKTATTINDIPGEILSMIFNKLVLQANQNTEPDPFETFNIASPSTPECRVILKARTVLRSVCKQWCECIDGDSMFWANIYINGTRIPGENEYFATKSRILGNLNPEDWLCTYRTPEQNRQLKEEAEDKLEVAAAVMSIARSKSQDINLILREPTYHLYSWRYNQVTPFPRGCRNRNPGPGV